MLRFPLPPIPNPGINVNDLPADVNGQLCAVLNHGNQWESLANIAGDLMNAEFPILHYKNQSNPSWHLLRDFGVKNCSVKTLDFLLELSQVHDALRLFRDTVPLIIEDEFITINGDSTGSQSEVVDYNGHVELACIAIGFPAPAYQWIHDDVIMEGKTSSNLIFNSFNPSCIGVYYCQLSQQQRDGSIQTVNSQPLKLSMRPYLPQICIQPQDYEVGLNSDHELHCIADGYPMPNYQWYKEEELLVNETASVLKLHTVTYNDRGYYMCKISNIVGSICSHKVYINVLQTNPAPVIIRHPCLPNSAPVRLGSDISFLCEAVGAEPLYYQWLCNGIPISSLDCYPVNPENRLHITVKPVNGQTVGLKYQCRVSNKYGCQDSNPVMLDIDISKPQVQHTASMKIALLVGNWDYENMEKLTKASDDVTTLASLLRQMEFNVISLANLSLTEFRNAINIFSHLIIPNAYVLVYYAGHGFLLHGNDYLLPVDVPPESEYRVTDCVDKNEILALIQKMKPKLFVLLLDMCRRATTKEINPQLYQSSPRVIQPQSHRNLVCGFATSEHLSAYEVCNERNGVFMKFLANELKSRIPVKEMLDEVMRRLNLESPSLVRNQMPAVYSNLAEDLSLCDPVDRSFIGSPVWNNIVSQLQNWQDLPPNSLHYITIDGVSRKVEIKFSKSGDCFLNEMIVSIIVYTVQDVTFKTAIHPRILNLSRTESHTTPTVQCCIKISNIQKLNEDAVLTVVIGSASLSISLRRPLISPAGLGSNNPNYDDVYL